MSNIYVQWRTGLVIVSAQKVVEYLPETVARYHSGAAHHLFLLVGMAAELLLNSKFDPHKLPQICSLLRNQKISTCTQSFIKCLVGKEGRTKEGSKNEGERKGL